MGPKILIVDDSVMIRVVTAKAFQGYECEVLEANNGVEGLAIASREKPDVIILDFSMPVMDGLEMLAKLKVDPDLRGVPVVMLTSEAGRETVLKIAKLGVKDYLIKPFKKDLLLERIQRMLNIKCKGKATAKRRRFDESLNVMVVDARPLIIEQIRSGLSDTTWNVEGFSQLDEAACYCDRIVPDVIFIGLTLSDDGTNTLYQLARANDKIRRVPVFALNVKAAKEKEEEESPAGPAIITSKLIDLEEIKTKVCRALDLDTSYKYIHLREDLIVVTLPNDFGPAVANEVALHLPAKLHEAVDAGLDKMVMDFSRLDRAGNHLIKSGLMTIQSCKDLSIKCGFIGSEAVRQECNNYEETKDWIFVSSLEEAVATLGSKVAVAA